jgi:hypothetical protein
MKCISRIERIVLLSSALFLLIIMATEAQSRYPLQPTSCWKVDSVNATWKIVENTRYFFNGDTTIGSTRFFRLYKSGVAHYDIPFYYNNVYVGALRDSENKIFFIKKNKTVESILFDFNLKVGDTIKSTIGKGKKIISIDTLQNGRRVFYHAKDHYNLGFFIEGIGSNGGLFSTGSSFVMLHSGEMANYLICYSENNSLVYQSEVGIIANCDIVNADSKFPVDTTSIWRIDCDSDYYVSPASEKYQYSFKGDTLIGQHKYFKLCKTGFYLAPGKDGRFISSFKSNEYVGALRDSEGKYYFISQDESMEKLLYDFNLKVGDYVISEIYKGEIVNSIDTCYDNRKRFYLGSDKYSKIIIEGIGTLSEFLKGYVKGSYLQCFSANNIPLYHYPSSVDCRLDMQNTTFPICDNVFFLPLFPTTNDNAALHIITCFQIPVNSEYPPFLSSYDIQKDEFTIHANLYYANGNTYSAEGTRISYTVFDTLALGHLAQGVYRVNCTINRVNNGGADTVFNEKNIIRNLFVTQASYIPSALWKVPNISVYPNPARDLVTVRFTDSPVALSSYDVFDIQGKKMISGRFCNSFGQSDFNIDTRMLPAGIYMIKININDSYTTHKIVIER